jgi:hypothetical protein
MRTLTQNQTAESLTFFMADSVDGKTGRIGLTPTVTLSKNGGAFASAVGAVTEVANGWYKVAGNATDSNTLGPLVLHATASGADPADKEYQVVAYNPRDTARLGLTSLPNALPGATDGMLILGTNAANMVFTKGVTITNNSGGALSIIGGTSGAYALQISNAGFGTAMGILAGTGGGPALYMRGRGNPSTPGEPSGAAIHLRGGTGSAGVVVFEPDAGDSVGFAGTGDATKYGVNFATTGGATYTNTATVATLQDGAITSVKIADGAITDAKFTFPAEAAGRASTLLAALRRAWEWATNKTSRDRSTGIVTLYGADNTTVLETRTQSTTGTTDSMTKGA